MAGFGFAFTYREPQEAIVRVCLAAAQARARLLGIRLRWRHVGPRHLAVSVDGNSRRMDLLGYRLERDLPLVAEGCEVDLTRVERQRLGRGIVDMLVRGRHVDQEGVMVLRGVAEVHWHYHPYDFDCPKRPRLDARLTITAEMLVAWNFEDIAAEVLLEELHTACELILEESINKRSKRLSFAELISAADDANLLPVRDDDLRPAQSLLTDLKDLRKDVRHRAAPGADAWLAVHWEAVAMLIERLVTQLRRQDALPSAGSSSAALDES